VASQAPATLSTTGAEAAVNPLSVPDAKGAAAQESDSVYSASKALKRSLWLQDGAYKHLVQKAKTLEQWSMKVRSPEAKMAIEAILSSIFVMKKSREEVNRSFKALYQPVSCGDQPQSKPCHGRTFNNQLCDGVERRHNLVVSQTLIHISQV